MAFPRTPLMNAILGRRWEEADEIVASGQGELGVAHPCHGTALMMACAKNRSGLALAIIATGQGNPGYVCASFNKSVLMAACGMVHSRVALALIATGESRPEHVSEFMASRTARGTAILWDHHDIVAALDAL
jgi:hypothetical protein